MTYHRVLGHQFSSGRSGEDAFCINVNTTVLKKEGLLEYVTEYLERQNEPIQVNYQPGDPSYEFETYPEFYVSALEGDQILLDRELDINLLHNLYEMKIISDGTVNTERYYLEAKIYYQELKPSKQISTMKAPLDVLAGEDLLKALVKKGLIEKHDDYFYRILDDKKK